MFKYSVGIKTTLLESLWRQKKYFKGYISAKLVIRTSVFLLNDFLGLVGAPNESLKLF